MSILLVSEMEDINTQEYTWNYYSHIFHDIFHTLFKYFPAAPPYLKHMRLLCLPKKIFLIPFERFATLLLTIVTEELRLIERKLKMYQLVKPIQTSCRFFFTSSSSSSCWFPFIRFYFPSKRGKFKREMM